MRISRILVMVLVLAGAVAVTGCTGSGRLGYSNYEGGN